jgi:hypothetical protein
MLGPPDSVWLGRLRQSATVGRDQRASCPSVLTLMVSRQDLKHLFDIQ